MQEQLTPELLREMVGVSQIPRPADKAAFLAAVKRHCPAALREQGRTGFVLVDVTVDATGAVEAVTAVPAARGPRPAAVVVRRDADGREVHQPVGGIESDPELGPAAEAALREVRFTPARRDTVAVPFTVRIGIQFTP
ncbi:MAG TPA: energy transducer TonB [Longimicrobium sp.]|nr:energy transducer TonB [Longimicrobium sp.]